MYTSGYVPAVGHYHPIRPNNTKLVWDILKAYTRNKKTHHNQPPQQQEKIVGGEGVEQRQEVEVFETEGSEVMVE